MSRVSDTTINKRYATQKLSVQYAHVGLLDVCGNALWISKKKFGRAHSMDTAHARMLRGGSNSTSVADKDRFVCYGFNTPHSSDGLVHGESLDWTEGHLMVRLDPNWNYMTQELIRSTDQTRLDRNLDQQYRWGRLIYDAYRRMCPGYPLSWHMIGPRPKDSMFKILRWPGADATAEEIAEAEAGGGLCPPG